MEKPRFISINDYSYSLPEERIAKYPLEQRDQSKLLVFKEKKISSNSFFQLPGFLPAKTNLVFNETRVIHARLKFRKASGSEIELFCLEPIEPADYQINFSSTSAVCWKCLVGNLKKWKGEILLKESRNGVKLFAKHCGRMENASKIEFSWSDPEFSFSHIIELFGSTPIPPYLNREAEDSDTLNYQTVYSRLEGSVAAPTAGLHFTENLLRELERKNIKKTFLNLHVGAGTFIPVKSENAVDHHMHIERMIIPKSSLTLLIENNEFIVPVGTTSCRSLESLYWIGEQLITGNFNEEYPLLQQWDAYLMAGKYSRTEVLMAITEYLDNKNLDSLIASTGIMITPGYTFKMTDALITNFHQPSSTLLMLIAALTGESWKEIYQYAMNNDFRFLSYGDSNLLFS